MVVASFEFLAIVKREVDIFERSLEVRISELDSEGKGRVKCDSKLLPLETERNLRPFTETGDSVGKPSEEKRAGGTLGTCLNWGWTLRTWLCSWIFSYRYWEKCLERIKVL